MGAQFHRTKGEEHQVHIQRGGEKEVLTDNNYINQLQHLVN